MLKRLIPKLWYDHPNFFIGYFPTATILHLGLAITQVYEKDRYMNSAFSKVYEAMPMNLWAFLSFFAFLFMTIGAYYKFVFWGRLGLGVGMFICLARGFLIELSPGSGAGLLIWLPLAAFHFSQLSEPPVNPLTKKG